jgi:ATP-dependent Lon protease
MIGKTRKDKNTNKKKDKNKEENIKTNKIKNTINTNDCKELKTFIDEKTYYIQEIIRNTIISIKKNKKNEIFSNNDANLSISVLTELYERTNEINSKNNTSTLLKEFDGLIDSLQTIIDKLSMIICGFGTLMIEDLLFISFGSEFKNIKTEDSILNSKFELIKKYIQPIGYKIVHWKTDKKYIQTNNESCNNKIVDTIVLQEDADMFECFDVDITTKLFYQKINGIKVVIQNEKSRKTLIINGLIEDIDLSCISNKYIEHRLKKIKDYSTGFQDVEHDVIMRILESFTLKDVLLYGNEDIQKKMIAVITETNSIRNKKIENNIKNFLESDIFLQRDILLNLLLYKNDYEIQYICYLLYDLLNVSSNDNNRPNSQTIIYDSLPSKIQSYLKDAVSYTIKYTNEMNEKYDIHKITLEQQIYMLKANENVKEKAMTKLKEIKGKPDELCLKSKQYLEGLIKIPFGVYRQEPVLKRIKEYNKWFIRFITVIETFFNDLQKTKKEKYTNIEMLKTIKNIEQFLNTNVLNIVKNSLEKQTIKQIMQIIQSINLTKKMKKEEKITISKQTKEVFIKRIIDYLNENPAIQLEVYDHIHIENPLSLVNTIQDMNLLKMNIQTIENTMIDINSILDESIYSHSYAKNQIMKIIGQWMNGEQSGYCFGFEGSPGIGKTSLAKKGIANCLKDEYGNSRPFAFIALGGSCNGSTLEGHGYTYMNSTWGRIVDILMESKCMNPIIYIDELDKVSKTENGKEIIGIFTHLIDQTQNDAFQDKYFSGIDIDLSKALFIFSYNDPEQIDKVLLDRIHRVKFDNLSIDDKMVIVRKYILPEINKKMGFENIVELSDEMIEYIIDSYTVEPGVRKLKEILFDLYGEINLHILRNNMIEDFDDIELPIKITKENIENKYLTKYNKIQENRINDKPEIGIINGLWANSLGRGGIIPIQTLFYPSSNFLDFKLTGLQGDVMKESMNVAKTLAWNLTPNSIKIKWIEEFEITKCQGLHIHCPEGGISKDGPSAGTAITIAIYSLLNKKEIKNDIAITGEINLQGEVTAIGGLDVKIIGGIKAGIKTFLYPKANSRDFLNWKNKNNRLQIYENIEFVEVSRIEEVFYYVFL